MKIIVESGRPTVVQPDPIWAGGVSEMRKIIAVQINQNSQHFRKDRQADRPVSRPRWQVTRQASWFERNEAL
ncbi:MAG: hypothetical protein HY678_06060 [Chloroflexi bacterium]|nr:hypothetical protein [Chloroflexota bacterium]